MKVHVRPHDSLFRFTFPLPLFFIKSRLCARVVAEAMKEDASDEMVLLTRRALKDAYKTIKDYVKANGHFYLVDIRSHDGDRVYIRV